MIIAVRQDPALAGPENMARDLALLSSDEIFARVYSWDGPWVSLGKNQVADERLRQSAVPWVVRPTGGLAVLHGHDATVGLVVSLADLGCGSREVKKAYRRISQPLIEALRACGLAAALAEETPFATRKPLGVDCFALNSPNDIVDPRTGSKVCGCAMAIIDGKVLIQASIPNGAPLVDPALVLTDAAPNIGQKWDSSQLAMRLEEALRYNFSNVRA